VLINKTRPLQPCQADETGQKGEKETEGVLGRVMRDIQRKCPNPKEALKNLEVTLEQEYLIKIQQIFKGNLLRI
jgi:hypothetical protein